MAPGEERACRLPDIRIRRPALVARAVEAAVRTDSAGRGCRILWRGHLTVGVGLGLGVGIVLFPRYGHGRRLADIAENGPGSADLISRSAGEPTISGGTPSARQSAHHRRPDIRHARCRIHQIRQIHRMHQMHRTDQMRRTESKNAETQEHRNTGNPTASVIHQFPHAPPHAAPTENPLPPQRIPHHDFPATHPIPMTKAPPHPWGRERRGFRIKLSWLRRRWTPGEPGAPHPRGERRPCAARWCTGQGAERGAAGSLSAGVLQMLLVDEDQAWSAW